MKLLLSCSHLSEMEGTRVNERRRLSRTCASGSSLTAFIFKRQIFTSSLNSLNQYRQWERYINMRVSHSTCIWSLQVVTSLFHASLLASLLFGSDQLLPGTHAAEVQHQQQQSSHQPRSQRQPVIHKQMNEHDLRKVFQVQSHDEVPEYDIVHLEVINKPGSDTIDADTLFASHNQNNEKDNLRTRRKRSNQQRDQQVGEEDGGNLKYVYLNAFGNGMHLNLRRNGELHHKLKTVKLFTAESSTSSRWTEASPSRSQHANVRYQESFIQGEGEDSIGVPYHDDHHVAAVIVSTGPDGQVTLVSQLLSTSLPQLV